MLHYEISGEGKVDLVLLHGFLEDNSIWGIMDPLLSSHFRLIKVEFPGHGKSPFLGDVCAMQMEAIAEELRQVTEFLKLETFHLLGHSMGGYVALAFAEMFPELLQSFTLFFSTFLADSAQKREIRKRSLSLMRENFPAYVSAGIPSLFNVREGEAFKKEIEATKRTALDVNVKAAEAAVEAMLIRPCRRDVLEKFENKILFILGRHDKALDLEKTLSEIPNRENIRLYLLDCAHNGHLERPEICAEILKTELKNGPEF